MLKPELQAKFLQHLNKKKKGNEGFTLIELLVVVIIIGVLAAIALPSLLNQVSKARQSEAKQNTGAINRAQQAYYLENANTFGSTLGNLAIGVKSQTDNYVYSVSSGGTGDFTKGAANIAASKAAKLKSYTGIVYSTAQTVGGVTEALTQATLCEGVTPFAGNAGAAEAVTAADISLGACSAMTPAMNQIK